MSRLEEGSYGDFRVMPEERAKELETAEKNAVKLVMAGSQQLRALQAEVVMLRRALDYYADRKNWRPRGLVPKVPIAADGGQVARKALGQV